MTKKIRVRFAPSPTGAIHIGNVRAAVFNWLFAKKMDGNFILRMEDTDTARSTKEAEEGIVKELSWLGISFDEGPDVGGDFGPYRQSERTSIYNEYLNKLVSSKKAYRCYCSKEELEEERTVQVQKSLMPSYSGKCRALTHEQEKAFIAEGKKPVVRLLIEPKRVNFYDIIKGEISYDSGSLGGDFVIQRGNGEFVYNFTVVIDDAVMKISHVIRGEDHLTNTIKQLLLYKALEIKPPEFAHCPLILGEDGKKLSKRFLTESLAMSREEAGNLAVDLVLQARFLTDSLAMFRADGILPDALINYTALLGWSSRSGTEIFSKEELISKFELKNVSSSPSTFSYDKLKWVNGEHIKKMDVETFCATLFEYLKKYCNSFNVADIDKEKFFEFAKIIKESLVILKDSMSYIDMFFRPDGALSAGALDIINTNDAKNVIKSFIEFLEEEPSLDKQSYQNITNRVKDKLNIKGKGLFMPLRAAITRDVTGPQLDDFCAFLGKESVIKRVNDALHS